MDPQIKRQRTLDAIKRIVVRESLKQPLIVIFEDLHWIDEQTQALLDLLADSIANARVLLLVNYRPEYRHEWSNKSHYVQIGLKALGREKAEELLTALLGDVVELQPLKRLIIERTGGNPFFIEEMVQALFDEGALVRNGAVKVTRSLSQVRLPPTVQGILAARIDRLSAEQKELLQTMAVIGREAPRVLISKMTVTVEAQLEQRLAELRAAEFIYEQLAPCDTEYVFKHALIQEVAYKSLLIERRKQLHEGIAQALESIFAAQLDDHLTQLAHHYSHSDNLDKAIEYLGRAGQQATQRSAHADAVSNLSAAIGLLQKLPEDVERIKRELPLQLAVGQASTVAKGFSAPEAKQAFSRARLLCEQLGDPPELFQALYGLWTVHLLRSECQIAFELAEQLLRRARDAREPALLSISHGALGIVLFEMGKNVSAREHLETAISVSDRERQVLIPQLSYLALTLSTLGYADQALKRSEEAVASAQDLGHPFTLVFALHFASFLRDGRQEARLTQELAERVIALSSEHGFPFWLAQATSMRGQAMAEQGLNEEGIAQMQDGLRAMRAIGMEAARGYHLLRLAKAYGEVGRLDEELGALREALAAADQNEESQSAAATHWLKGELLLRQNQSNAAEAQTSYQRAIEIARRQNAKSFELHATTSLARLLASQGHRDEARIMLAEIYDWFTEGFDTVDLKDAKALLDQLSN
jgi:tetratricopeptide (TPR) repeat protein